jgi:hypothetical protein
MKKHLERFPTLSCSVDIISNPAVILFRVPRLVPMPTPEILVPSIAGVQTRQLIAGESLCEKPEPAPVAFQETASLHGNVEDEVGNEWGY